MLAVYRGTSVTNLVSAAYNDNAGYGVLTSRVRFRVYSDDVFRIAVDGANGASGSVVLTWTRS